MLNNSIENIILYALEKKLLNPCDINYSVNRILSYINIDSYNFNITNGNSSKFIESIDFLFNFLYPNSKFNYEKDIFESEIINCLLPRPSEFINTFNNLYKKSPKSATSYFYNFSINTNYIKKKLISKNIKWKTNSIYGTIELSINLAKPEKDPKEIELMQKRPSNNYPLCFLCPQNEGYKGHVAHPARAILRTIPVCLNNEKWHFQYSPYSYFNNHCIIFNDIHSPMNINKETFIRLFDFVDKFPHYFIGSNADLPIVGGSMLSHDHYQGGEYIFPIDKAISFYKKTLKLDNKITVELLNWPLSSIKLTGENKDSIINFGYKIHNAWKNYNNKSLNIISKSDNIFHNTTTPIVRKNKNEYSFILILRNNRCDDLYPDGIFHPHKEIHPVKKENIGLIEAMGVAILPKRLKKFKDDLLKSIKSNSLNSFKKENTIYLNLINEFPVTSNDFITNYNDYFNKIVSKFFINGLEHCGVFKQNDNDKNEFILFINSIL